MPKLYHVVTEDNTTTFSDKDTAHNYVQGFPAPDEEAVLCESEVTGEQYDRFCRWGGSIGGGEEGE